MTDPWMNAIKALEEGRNILLTGGAGTGKSYTLGKIIEYLDDNELECARTAMTGMASLQLPGGQTVHSCFGTGTITDPELVYSVTTNFMFEKETKYNLAFLKVIIIDEISMMRSDYLELLDAILKQVMNNDRPFGGKQVIFSGDFMQLPPVVKDSDEELWAFESPVWEQLNFKVIYLTEIKRQDDPNFAKALNFIRAGRVSDYVNGYFQSTLNHKFPEKVEPVKLMSTNKEVELSNHQRLQLVEAEDEKYVARIWAKNDYLRKKIINDCTAMEILNLRKGCQVMLLKNCKGVYVNGSMGVYLGKGSMVQNEKGALVDSIRVRLLDTGLEVCVPRASWEIKNHKKDEVEATFDQFPVKLGYAITIHKSQGMSINYLEVNLNKCFADGMAYVALSRARSYQGLRILNWNPKTVKCNEKAFNFYMNLKNQGVI